MQRLPEATRRKISWGNIKINSMVVLTMTIVIQTILMGIIKSGNRVNLHVENANRIQIRFSQSL